MKRIIICAADENFSDLLLDLVHSTQQWDEPLADAIGLLDLGLSPETLAAIKPIVTHIVTPEWDLSLRPDLITTKPYIRANTARPFLPKYFPGYDLYLWLDADTWVQERFAIDQLFAAASEGAIGIVPQDNECYIQRDTSIDWRRNRLRDYFGDEGDALYDANPYFNSGAFSLRRDAPHWELWAKHFAAGLTRSPGLCSDQTALNFAIWKEALPFQALPALCNWTCHLALPSISASTGKLCMPREPFSEIGLIHLTAHTKNMRMKLNHPRFPASLSLRFNGRNLSA